MSIWTEVVRLTSENPFQYWRSNEIPLPDLRRRKSLCDNAQGRDGQDDERVRRIRRKHQEERPSPGRLPAAPDRFRDHRSLTRRQGLDDGRTVRRNEGTAWRFLPDRGQGSERRGAGRVEDPIREVRLDRGQADRRAGAGKTATSSVLGQQRRGVNGRAKCGA